jgi:hypothetical protein
MNGSQQSVNANCQFLCECKFNLSLSFPDKLHFATFSRDLYKVLLHYGLILHFGDQAWTYEYSPT